ncbi:MAG TPA: hypothetical protein VK196_06115 [Magnetospirillum sp.]|nr:hypothetical protein [Magnetospirillum sp.]
MPLSSDDRLIELKLKPIREHLDALSAQVQGISAVVASMPQTKDIDIDSLKVNLQAVCQRLSSSQSRIALQTADAILELARQPLQSNETK